jgi:hypothetical protein
LRVEKNEPHLEKIQKTKENQTIKDRELATVRNESVAKLLSMTGNKTFGLHEDENLFD